MQKQAEAANMAKQQKSWQARIDLKTELERKIQKRKRKEAEKEIERKSLKQTDEALKRREEDIKMVKQQEIQSQKEFLTVTLYTKPIYNKLILKKWYQMLFDSVKLKSEKKMKSSTDSDKFNMKK